MTTGRRTPPSESGTRTASTTAAVGQRLAILLDVHELSSQARELDGELAVNRLLRRVGRNRATIRAVAYITSAERRLAGSLRDSGLEVVEVEPGATAAVQIAVDAMAIAGRVDCVVLAPAQAALAPLATVLRSQGLRVETASFAEDTGPSVVAQQHLTLGEDSLFRP
jgi:predicted nuclease with RNAse H fold